MWHEFKMLFLEGLGASPPQLHLIAGIVLYLGALALIRRPILSLAVVVGLQLVNEGLDLADDLTAGRTIDPTSILADIAWTLAAPVVIAFGLLAWRKGRIRK